MKTILKSAVNSLAISVMAFSMSTSMADGHMKKEKSMTMDGDMKKMEHTMDDKKNGNERDNGRYHDGKRRHGNERQKAHDG